MIKVLVGAPLASVRAGLRSMVEQGGDIVVVGESGDASDLLRLAELLRPDLLVLDTLSVGRALPAVHLADVAESPAGIPEGWISRDVDAEELLAAVRAVAAGLVVMAPSLMVSNRVRSPSDALAEPLSPREREVLQLLAEGIPNKQIASRLGVSPHTVKFHVALLLTKLGSASRTEAVTSGLRLGLISV